ncbi:MAG: MarR family winged helix-turn-helix transcriptional regulator [Thermodesulfobacteriota bacterium]
MKENYEDEIAGSLRRIVRSIEMYNRRLSEQTGLSVSQYMALRALKDAGSCTAGELADRVGISRGTATGILDQLQSQNLVLRRRRPNDRRRVYVSLTRLGRRLASELQPPLQEPLDRLLKELPDQARFQTAEALSRVARVFES